MSQKQSDVAILIPAYNEETTLSDLIDRLRSELPNCGIIVMDDGSVDQTAEVARSAGAVVLRLPFNLGIGAAMQTGYRYAKRKGYRIAVQVDGDGQHPPEEIHRLIEPIRQGADLVIGCRFLGRGDFKSPLMRRLGMLFFSFTISTLVGRRFHDTTSGFRAAGRSVIEYYSDHYPSDYPEPEAILLLCRAGFDVREVPAKIVERGGGHSSITAIRGVYYLFKVFLAIAMGTLRPVRRPGRENE